jgi:chromosome segregation protein
LDLAVQLWERYAWSAPHGPILVTLDGEVVDASGIVTGGQVQSTPGLLERRREVIDLEAKRHVLVTDLDQSKQQRDIMFAQIQELTQRDRQLGDSLRDAEMQNLSLRKDEEKLQHVLTDLDHRLNAVGAEIQEGLGERERVEGESQSVQAQLGQWIAEKNGQDALLGRVRERLGLLDQDMRTHQDRVTDAKLTVEGLRARREHEQLNRARVTQQMQEAEERRCVLGEHLNSLKSLIEQSQTEQARQETLCQDLGVTAGRVKGELVAAQERQAQHMSASQTLEVGLEDVRRGLG